MTDLQPPAGIVTFLFTDIEGSTQLWEQAPEAMKVALARHDAILRLVIEAHHGYIFKTMGDAFYAAFANAPQAVSAALEAQRALHTENWGETAIKVRMGLHTGAVETRDNDYFGPPLNRVARLMAAGHGEQTLLSAATKELLQNHLPDDANLRDMGERRLKDLTRPEHIYQLLVPDLPAEFPPLKTLDTFRTNLPAQLTSFIGRKKEIAAVKQLISPSPFPIGTIRQERGMSGDGARITTLTGPGGTGKTRLSLQVASDLLDSFPDGVWFVEFAPLADPALVTQTVLTSLGLREETGRPLLDALIDYLREKKALLILDNCEHLVETSAQLAEALLQACPNLRLLVSSREALGIAGETAYRVPSLAIPDARLAQSAKNIMQCEATRLFIERAQTALPTFAITNENASAIAHICARLDGIPLAIELAAARVKMLKVEQIAERLDDRFRLLTGGSRTALPRQQTLRALIDWSYDLLSEPERTFLRRLSVFAGGWTLEATEETCGGDQLPAFDILDLLTQLVNKSLVIADTDSRMETRYHLLETVRQYARDKLTDAGEGLDARNRHLQYFLGFAKRAEPEMTGPLMAEWLQHIGDEIDNIRAALEWSLKQDVQAGLRLASALMRYWPAHNDNSREGVDWLSQLLRQPAASTPNLARAEALTALSFLYSWQFDPSKAQPFAEQGLALYRDLDDQCGIAFTLFLLGWNLCFQDKLTAGRPLVFESLALYRTLGDRLGMAEVLGQLGMKVDGEDYARARAYVEESLALCRELGYVFGIADQLSGLGHLALRQGDYSLARASLTEALEILRSLGVKHTLLPSVIASLGSLSLRDGDDEQARVYLEESLSLLHESGGSNNGPGFFWPLAHLGYVALRQSNQARARSMWMEAQQGFKDTGNKLGIAFVLEGLASLAVLQGQPEGAASLFAWADVTREIVGDLRPAVEQADVDRDLAVIHTQLDEAAFAEAQSAGRAMSIEEAIALGIESTHD